MMSWMQTIHPAEGYIRLPDRDLSARLSAERYHRRMPQLFTTTPAYRILPGDSHRRYEIAHPFVV
jgi:hypothetical protein